MRLSSSGLGAARGRGTSLAGATIGQAVEVQGSRGVVRFSGPTEFASGRWFGIELDQPQGKNDGSVNGKRYFECAPMHGVFVRSSQVKVLGGADSEEPGGASRSRATIHGAEIQTDESRLRPPSGIAAGGPDALRAARRATVQPGRIAPPSSLLAPGSSSIAPPPGTTSRLGGVQSRRLSEAQNFGRRTTLSDAPSPGPLSDTRSQVQAPASDAESPNRPEPQQEQSAAAVAASETPAKQPPSEMRTPIRATLNMEEPAALEVDTPTASEPTVPQKKYEELRVKFRFLEQKRSEDRQRLQEADALRSEAEQALRVREKLANKVAAQQNEIRTLKQQLKTVEAARDESEARYTETLEAMEMLAVDKEMAEERAEALAQEATQGTSADTDTNDAELIRQNERLKEALVRLRDVSAEREAQQNQRDADTAAAHRSEVQALEAQVEDLKEQLDDALSAEEVVASLTDRNMELSAKVEELQGAVESLEALCEVNNEMEETRAEEAQSIRAELERMSAVAAARARRISALEEAIADHEYSAVQFRDLVAALQADVARLREREQTQASEAADAALQAQEALSRNLQLRSSALRSRAAAVDLELRRLDADQAAARLEMTEPFLPAHFGTDADAISTVLAFRRVAAKADIVCRQLEQDTDVISDDFVAAAAVRALLAQLSGDALLVAASMRASDSAKFVRMAALLPDAQAVERRLTGLVDLVRSEEFRAADTLGEVRRLAGQMRALADAHVPAKMPAVASQRLANIASYVAFAADELVANAAFAEQLLASGSQLALPLSSLAERCRAAKSPAVKLLRRTGDMLSAGLELEDSQALDLAAPLAQTCSELREFCTRARTVVKDSTDSESQNDPARLPQDLSAIAYDVFGAADAAPLDVALNAAQRLTHDLSALLTCVSGDLNMQKAEPIEAPWSVRATQFKASLVQNADVEKRTGQLNEEIVSLARELKLRDQTIQELGVKSEMLEKRSESMRRQAEQISELRKLLDETRAKERTYEEALESLQAEMEAVESECRKLRQAEASSKQAAQHVFGSALGSGGIPVPPDLLGLRNKIATLQSSVAYLRKENAHLRAKYMYQLQLPPLRSAAVPSEVSEAVREAKVVVKEACRLAAMPRLVRIAPQEPVKTGWQPMSSRPQFELYRQQTLAQSLKQRVESVQERLRAIPRLSMMVSGT
ncbi:hypothetical protein EV183_003492 [Coemansia sp. RSA 2336]|nr:hypothetical protein EV183_003492 [Coemansia sp. RSA 2336]